MYSSVIFVSVTVITFSTFSFAKYVEWEKETFFFETVEHENESNTLSKIPGSYSKAKYTLGFLKEGKIMMMCSSILFKNKSLGSDKDTIGAHFSSSNCLPVFTMHDMKEIISDPIGNILLFKYPEFKKENYEYMVVSRKVYSQGNEGVSFFMKFAETGAADNWI